MRWLAPTWTALPSGSLPPPSLQTGKAAAAYIPSGLDVLTLLDGRVAEIVAFLNADLTRFGLPERVRP
jgi:hypothetical protein